jgi:hypothetical protein
MLIEKKPKVNTFFDDKRIIPKIEGILNRVEIKKQIIINIFLENFDSHFIKTSLMHQKF